MPPPLPAPDTATSSGTFARTLDDRRSEGLTDCSGPPPSHHPTIRWTPPPRPSRPSGPRMRRARRPLLRRGTSRRRAGCARFPRPMRPRREPDRPLLTERRTRLNSNLRALVLYSVGELQRHGHLPCPARRPWLEASAWISCLIDLRIVSGTKSAPNDCPPSTSRMSLPPCLHATLSLPRPPRGPLPPRRVRRGDQSAPAPIQPVKPSGKKFPPTPG